MFRIYDTSYSAGEQILGYGVGNTSGNGTGFNIATDGTRGIRLNFCDGSVNYFEQSGTIFTNSTWHHVCIVNKLSSSTTDIYVDVTTTSPTVSRGVDPGALQGATDDFVIGEPVPEYGDFGYGNFTGRLAHVSFWTTELTGTEVLSMHDDSTCPSDVQTASLKVFVPLIASPATESAQSLSITTNGDPTLVSDPTLPSCGGGGSVNFMPILTEIIGY